LVNYPVLVGTYYIGNKINILLDELGV